MKCEVIVSGKMCEKPAKYIVRHRDSEKRFPVCEVHIPAYKFRLDGFSSGSFIVKKAKP